MTPVGNAESRDGDGEGRSQGQHDSKYEIYKYSLSINKSFSNKNASFCGTPCNNSTVDKIIMFRQIRSLDQMRVKLLSIKYMKYSN